ANVAAQQIVIDVVGPSRSMWDLVASRQYHLGLIAWPAPGHDATGPGPPNRIVQLIYCDPEPLSSFAFQHMTQVLDHKSSRVIRSRLAQLGQSEMLLSPILVNDLSTASPDQQYAK